MAKTHPLEVPEGWGSVEEVVNAPLIGVPQSDWWICVFFNWVFLLVYLLSVLPGLCCSCVLVETGIGLCGCTSTFSALGAVRWNDSLLLAPFKARNQFALLVAFLRNKATRLRLFYCEWRAFGGGRYWWHGDGPWMHELSEVDQTLRGVQMRKAAFGCIRAPIPDMFPSGAVVFLPNMGSDSEWAAIRFAMHQHLFQHVEERMGQLAGKISGAWPSPKLKDLDDSKLVGQLVSKSVFFCLFGVWIGDGDAEVVARWNTAAKTVIFPRSFQRLVFNILIRRMKGLRVETVGVVQRWGLQQLFADMNESLPARYRRPTVAKLCDEIMYILCFAGVNGTTAALTTCAAFMQNKCPPESWEEQIDLSRYGTPEQMRAVYKKDPHRYIKEACRVDPPVTSATTSVAEDRLFEMAGRSIALKAGTLMQYTISLANRDEAAFADPGLFNPDRPELDKAVTWNGAFETKASAPADEQSYPRLCPGRYLAIDIVQRILDHAISQEA